MRASAAAHGMRWLAPGCLTRRDRRGTLGANGSPWARPASLLGWLCACGLRAGAGFGCALLRAQRAAPVARLGAGRDRAVRWGGVGRCACESNRVGTNRGGAGSARCERAPQRMGCEWLAPGSHKARPARHAGREWLALGTACVASRMSSPRHSPGKNDLGLRFTARPACRAGRSLGCWKGIEPSAGVGLGVVPVSRIESGRIGQKPDLHCASERRSAWDAK